MPNQSPHTRVASADHTCIVGPQEATREVMINPVTGIMSCMKCVEMFRGEYHIRRHLRSDNHKRQLGLSKKEAIEVSFYSIIYLLCNHNTLE